MEFFGAQGFERVVFELQGDLLANGRDSATDCFSADRAVVTIFSSLDS